jgi:hypothetical protein
MNHYLRLRSVKRVLSCWKGGSKSHLYKLWYRIPSYKMSVTEYTSKRFLWVWSCPSVNWNLSVDRAIRLNSKQPLGMHSFMWWLVLYEGIRCDNIYSWFCRIHVLCSLHSFDFSTKVANLYPKYRTLQFQHFLQTFKNLI